MRSCEPGCFLADPAAAWGILVQRQRTRLVAYVMLLTVFVGGIDTVPAGPLEVLAGFAAHPFSGSLFSTYHGEAPLWFVMAHVLGATTLARYLTFCVIVVVLAYVLLYEGARRTRRAPDPVLMLLLFAAHPVAHILQTWLGMEDGLTVVCTTLLLFLSSPWRIGLVAGLSLCNHPATAFIAPTVVMLRCLGDTGGPLRARHVLAAVLGVVLAKALLMLAFWGAAIETGTRLQYVQHTSIRGWGLMSLAHLPTALYSFNYGVWVPVVLMLGGFFRANPRLYGCYGACMVAYGAVTFFTRDTTRVFALLSWAPTLLCLLYTWRIAPGFAPQRAWWFRWSMVACALLGWLFPHVVVWDGRVHAPWFTQSFGIP